MKWLRFLREGRATTGVLEGDVVHVYEGSVFDDVRATGEALPLAGLDLLAPCAPGKVIALWNNFRAAAEKNGWAVPAEPLYLMKSPGSVLAPGRPIPVPAAYDGRVTYEGELGIVIGRR
ncbi:MAG: DUF2437 domain-containing protein, partial [Rubrivivax sp.]|nr:DUF2437 domain-containing protein [Rubrivivax sp.]